MERQIRDELQTVQRFLRANAFWRGSAIVGVITLALTLMMLGSHQYVAPTIIALGSSIAFAALVLVAASALGKYRTLPDVAERIERRFPELQQRLLTSVTHLDRSAPAISDSLTDFVMHQSLVHARKNDWVNVEPTRKQPILRGVTVLSLGIAAPLLWNLAHRPAPPTTAGKLTAAAPIVSPTTTLNVLPGDIELERGSPLVISAHFQGPLPRRTKLTLTAADGTEQTVEMTQRLKDPVFAFSLPQVRGPLHYRVEYEDRKSQAFDVRVFDYPELVQADAVLDYPDYTQLPKRTIVDTRRVSAVEGSELTWETHLNKAVEDAWLEDSDGQRIELAVDSTDPLTYRSQLQLQTNARWKLFLRDAAGRKNKFPAELVATVAKNRPPALDLASAGDVDVSPLQELPIKAKLWDDFGVTRYGVAFAMASEPIKELALGTNVAAKQQVQLAYLLDFEAFQAEPDQLLAYHFWAEDLGPDGKPRRTQSDIYFAEVRHFEEIFREAASSASSEQQGPPSENEQQAEKLLELQKQIISATWNVKRKQVGPKVDETFSADTLVLLDSQLTAHEQAAAAGSRLRDETSRKHLAEATTFMMTAIDELQVSRRESDAKKLDQAISAEQSAYQSLLKLRAREHEVSRSRSQSQSASSSSRRQQREKLQDLELKNDQDRYETERQAATQQQTERAEANQEMREVLQGLQDLARRQQDLNRQLQELQIALQKAEAEEERKEIERQLQRLREQQDDLLRDSDEVDQKMNEAQNQPEIQRSRQQLEKSREELRKSAEATERGEVGQALAAGTRAERQFREMSEAIRHQTAQQFSDEMTAMRNLARELSEQQDKLADELRANEKAETPGLRAGANTADFAPMFDQQVKRVGDLLKQMEQTVSAAETSEPLLAQKLYDGLRQANRDKIGEALQATRGLLDSNLKPQAEAMEATANEAIKRLRESVDRAAEGILGNELEGLRRAAGELSSLAEQLDRELASNSEPADPQKGQVRDATGQQSSRSGQPRGNEDLDESRPTSQHESSETDAVAGTDDSDPNREPSPNRNTQESTTQDSDARSESTAAQSAQSQNGQAQNGQAQNASSNASDAQQPGSQATAEASDGSPAGSADGARPSNAQADRSSAALGRGRRAGSSPRESAAQPSNENDSRNAGGLLQTLGGESHAGPIAGDGYRSWADRLRDVEEMLGSPELRGRAAQIRDRARNLRRDMKRQSQSPQWQLVEELVATPLEELRQQVELELARQSGKSDSLAPIDRDPVPNQFSERVRRYYERLGQGTAP